MGDVLHIIATLEWIALGLVCGRRFKVLNRRLTNLLTELENSILEEDHGHD